MQTIQASQFEDLFEEQLRLYDSDRDMLDQERKDQDQIADQVREANKAFTRAHTGDASTKERETALQDLENGYLKYKEILSNLDVGRKFYNDLAKIVGRFRDDAKAFVHQRRMEASQLEAYVPRVDHPSITILLTYCVPGISRMSQRCLHCISRSRTCASQLTSQLARFTPQPTLRRPRSPPRSHLRLFMPTELLRQ